MKAIQLLMMMKKVVSGWASFNISDATYDSKSVSLSPYSGDDMCFSVDGTALYIVKSDGNIYQFTLSTPWDISTAIYASKTFNVYSQGNGAYGIRFKEDGLKMYIVYYFSRIISQYSLSTPWDISTASYDDKSISIVTSTSSPMGLHFKPDGTKVFFLNSGGRDIYCWNLSTPWDISTATYNNTYYASSVYNPNRIFFNPQGTVMWLMSPGSHYTNSISQHNLSTPWDISTATYNSVKLNMNIVTSTGTSIFFRETDGKKLYILSGGNVYQLNTFT